MPPRPAQFVWPGASTWAHWQIATAAHSDRVAIDDIEVDEAIGSACATKSIFSGMDSIPITAAELGLIKYTNVQ